MKKLMICLFIMGLIGFNIQSVSAASFSATLSGPRSIFAGQQFELSLGVTDAVNYFGLGGTLNYDANALTLVSVVGTNGYTVTNGVKLIADSVAGKSGAFSFATLTFKANAAFAIGSSTTISYTGVKGSDGTTDFSGNDASVAITMAAPKSTNNFLSALSISGSTITFSKNTLNYKVIVENSVASVTLSATAEDAKASIGGTGTKTLKDYSNVFNIVVTAENGSKKTYSVNVVRKDASGNAGALSKNNSLAMLTVSGYELGFGVDQLNYTLDVDNTVTKVEVSATAADEYAKVVIDQIDPLVVGNNSIKVTVTAENGDKKVYTILVNRSGDAPTVPIEKLIDSLKIVTSERIAVNTPVDGVIGSEILTALKESGKSLVVKGKIGDISYEWQIDGAKITDQTSILTKLSFVSENESQIDALSGFAKGIVLSFEHNDTLPEGTQLTLYLGSQYKDGDTLQLYYYNSEIDKLEQMGESLVVADGKVVISLTHTSDYLLTPAVLNLKNADTINLWFYISIIETILMVLGIGYFILRNKKTKSRINHTVADKDQTEQDMSKVNPSRWV